MKFSSLFSSITFLLSFQILAAPNPTVYDYIAEQILPLRKVHVHAAKGSNEITLDDFVEAAKKFDSETDLEGDFATFEKVYDHVYQLNRDIEFAVYGTLRLHKNEKILKRSAAIFINTNQIIADTVSSPQEAFSIETPRVDLTKISPQYLNFFSAAGGLIRIGAATLQGTLYINTPAQEIPLTMPCMLNSNDRPLGHGAILHMKVGFYKDVRVYLNIKEALSPDSRLQIGKIIFDDTRSLNPPNSSSVENLQFVNLAQARATKVIKAPRTEAPIDTTPPVVTDPKATTSIKPPKTDVKSGLPQKNDPLPNSRYTPPPPPPQTTSTNDNTPWGVPTGVKGYVYSPYVPTNPQTKIRNRVDVRDIDIGTKVKCPYTEKIFRVPAN